MDNYSLLLTCDSLYLDTCALVKIEFEEGLSSNLARFLAFGTKFEIHSSFLAFGEFVCVTGRKKDRIDFQSEATRLYSKYPGLGGGDLWHLIAALRLTKQRPSAGFLTFDRGLWAAALKEGVRTLDGNAMDVTVVESKLRDARKLKGT